MEVAPIIEEKKEQTIDKWFHIVIVVKGVQGFIELIAGVVAYLVPIHSIIRIVDHFTEEELLQDPGDFISNHLADWAHGLSIDAKYFAGLYLVSHGIVKLFLMWSLLSGRLWAYPTGIAVIGIMNLYQIYHLFRHFSFLLLLATLFNFVIMYLIWREYQIVLKNRAALSGAGS